MCGRKQPVRTTMRTAGVGSHPGRQGCGAQRDENLTKDLAPSKQKATVEKVVQHWRNTKHRRVAERLVTGQDRRGRWWRTRTCLEEKAALKELREVRRKKVGLSVLQKC